MSFTPPKTNLPPTSAKTPVGKAPKPAPKKPAPKAPSDPYGVMASLAPALQALSDQQAQQTAAQNQQRQAIAQATNEFLKYVTGQPSVQGDYQNAAATEGALGNAAAAYLRSQNPNDQIQGQVAKMLNPEQQQELAGRLNDIYGQGAAALFGQSGLIPGSTLAENGAAAAAFQKSQAPNVALQGLRGLRQFAYDSSQANQALAAKKAEVLSQIPALTQKAKSDAAALAAKTAYENAQLGLASQRVNLEGVRIQNQAAEFNARQKQQQDQFIANYNRQAREFNATQKAKADKLALPNATLSRAKGYLVDSAGNPIPGANGQPQVLPGFKIGANGQVVKVGTAGGGATSSQIQKFVDGLKVPQYQTVRKTKNGESVSTKVQTGVTFKMGFQAAYRRLRAMGVDDVTSRQYLDTVYKRGQAGRGWLTNEEQAALARTGYVGLASNKKAHVYQGHGYLTPQQVVVLRERNLLPSGEAGVVNGQPVYWIAP